MKKIYIAFVMSLVASATLFSCLKQDYQAPPDASTVDPGLPVNITIADLKTYFAGSPSAVAVDSDWTIYGIVTADDRSGNFYKQITIEDSTGGITIQIDGTSLYAKYPIGRKLYVKLKGLYYGFYNKLPQIGYVTDNGGSTSGIPSTLVDNFIVRANYPNTVPITKFDGLSQLKSVNNDMLNRLVQIDNVEVISDDLSKTYAQSSSIASGTSITLQDCDGNTIILRNSAYADFQSLALPKGKGSIIALYTTYNADPQLVIRDTTDVNMRDTRCDGSSANTTFLLDEGFTTLSDWNAQSVTGDQVWTTATYGDPKPCAYMSGYANSVYNANEDWLISKELDLTVGYTQVSLQFETATKYSGNKLECYISTDYSGTGLPATATWTLLPATYDETNAFTFTSSGVIDLSSYVNKKVHIAFKYTSTASAAASWELDNVKVSAE